MNATQNALNFRRPARSTSEENDSNDTSQPSPSGQQQQQQQEQQQTMTTVKEEEREEKEETPRAEERGDVTKDEGSPGTGKVKKQDGTGDVATAEVVAAAAGAEGVSASVAAVGANTVKEEKEEEKAEILKKTSGGDPKEENRISGASSQPEGAAGEKADAGTNIEERVDRKPETRVGPGVHKPAAAAHVGGGKGLVEKELPVPAGGGLPENDSSDEDDGDGFRIVVGREAAPPAAPAAPTKRFLRGEDVTLW